MHIGALHNLYTKMEASGQHNTPAPLPQKKASRHPMNRRLDVSRGGLDNLDKNPLNLPEFAPDRPTRSLVKVPTAVVWFVDKTSNSDTSFIQILAYYA